MITKDYLARIKHHGRTEPTADTLHALHLAHLQSVPFENLDIGLGWPISLDQEALYDKIVRRRRGGFCYELNGSFSLLLRELGFDVTLLSARVAGSDGCFGPEFDHLTLLVRCPADRRLPEAPWLADVGFGDSFLLPLRLDRIKGVQLEGQDAYRIDDENGRLSLRRRKGEDGEWEEQYRFTLRPRTLSEFAGMCRYHQSSPESHFTQRRVCTLARENGRITLSDNRFIETLDGRRQERIVGEQEYGEILARRFGISLPETRNLRF